MAEIDVQKEAEGWLDENKIFHFRAGYGGLPDVIVCHRGRFIGMEFKTPKGETRGHQKTIGNEITKSGGITTFPRSVDAVKKIIRKVEIDTLWER